MKIGLVLECTLDGPDHKVYALWAKKLLGDTVRIEPSCAGNKRNLVTQAGKRVKALLAESCDKVLIIWDLMPPWKQPGVQHSAKVDIKAVTASLRGADVTDPCVYLICVNRELETLLIADGSAISRALEIPHGKGGPGNKNQPRTTTNPKAYLSGWFQRYAGRPYTDYQHAAKIADKVDFSRVRRRCSEAAKFEDALRQNPCQPPIAWTP